MKEIVERMLMEKSLQAEQLEKEIKALMEVLKMLEGK